MLCGMLCGMHCSRKDAGEVANKLLRLLLTTAMNEPQPSLARLTLCACSGLAA
jgi:hypothetical protein